MLIAIEGIDGAGKTTQVKLLADRLRKLNYPVLETKEPTDGTWGQKIRDTASTGRLKVEDEFLLFLKDRHEHVKECIIPALELGKIVLVDRYYFSSVAYQGARGIPVEYIINENEKFALEPDLLILLDIDATVGLARVQSRGNKIDLFEKEDLLEKSAAIFRSIDKPYLVKLNARRSIEDLHGEIFICVLSKIMQQKT